MISIREKVTVESIKSSALEQVRSISGSIVSSLVGAAQNYIKNVIAGALGGVFDAIGSALSLFETGRLLFNKVRGTVSKLAKANAGDVKNILDPARNSILPIPFLPDNIPTTIPDLDSDILPIFLQTLTQIQGFGVESVLDLYKTFESLSSRQKAAGEEETITLEDNFSEVFQGMPVTNDPLPENISAVTTNQSYNKFLQATTLQDKISYLSSLNGTSFGDIKFIRERLRALQESSELYSEIIDSPFTGNVSDQIALPTLGHTVDTPALDPEDWAGGSSKIDNPDGRLSYGPAKIIPVTSKYKATDNVARSMQESYDKINEKMYYNLYRDRYYSNDLSSGSYLDYGVNRYDMEDSEKYGFVKLAVSHMNMGDYSSIGFSRININESIEITDGLNGKLELMPLIGYLQNINNLNAITVKPVYSITINGLEIPVDSRGNRNLLPASKPDETAVIM